MDRMGGMLTNGLGSTACNALIYGPFRLKCFVNDAGHGSAPHARVGSKYKQEVEKRLDLIKQFEVDRLNRERQSEDDIAERNQEIFRKKRVTLVFSFNDKAVEKEFIVSKERADKVVKVVDFINRTTSSISLKVDAFKKKLHDIKIKMSR